MRQVRIFPFSHCRDVDVEVSRTSGFGVLDSARMNLARLRAALRGIDNAVDDRPCSIDVLMPPTCSDAGEFDSVRGLPDGVGVPPLPTANRDTIFIRL